jgi:cobalt/nickel transport system ATP-binding protein
MKNHRKAVVVKNLSYTYPDGTNALNRVSFEIHSGESIALVGSNGAGKSTLLLHLNRIIENQRGSIEIQGKVLNKKNVKEIRKRVGLVFQDPENQLFMSTVFDDIAFGPINMGLSEKEVHKRVKSALRKINLDGYDDRCPHHLSFGEKKKIAMATVLSIEPDILLLDEPTSNLDPYARRKMIDMLANLHSTKIIASHDIEMLLEICDRCILLDHGKIAAIGKVEDVLTNTNLLREHGLDVPTVVRLFGIDALEIIRNKLSDHEAMVLGGYKGVATE